MRSDDWISMARAPKLHRDIRALAYLTSILAFITPEKVWAAGWRANADYTEVNVVVNIDLIDGNLSLVEKLDCLSVYPAETREGMGTRFVALFFSKPLCMMTQDKPVPVFGNIAPMVTAVGGVVSDVSFEGNGSGLNPGTSADGYYAIHIAFDGALPERYQVTVSYRRKVEIQKTTKLIYGWFKRSDKIIYIKHPMVDWGPYELRVNCEKRYELSLEKGTGWVEKANGKASIDLENGENVWLRVVPR
jgi:hypothetical protein